jgi:glycosyltransferase involved in cell wall biosynthesis
MRLAFHQFGSQAWLGGNTFFEGLFAALRSLGDARPTLVLLVEEHVDEADYQSVAVLADEVRRVPPLPPEPGLLLQKSLRYHIAWWLRHRGLKRPVVIDPHPLTQTLPRQHIDAYFGMVTYPAPITSVPTIVWVPDFQHRRLPEKYGPVERATRDRHFMAQARWATQVVVTAEEVRRDFEAFAPDLAYKARVIHFVADIPEDVYKGDPYIGLAQYCLPEKFIYLPNQFWQHKNHQLVFDALSQLTARGVHPQIVCSGNPIDYRRPSHFSELMQHLSIANLRDQFIWLGVVPRLDVFRLMRQSICVMNPSKFEGLGLSVAESKSLGKRVLASDLGPLREQAAPGAVYFDPNDPSDLAAKMEAIWTSVPPGPDRELEAAARAEFPNRQAAFGRELLQLFAEAQANFARQSQPVSRIRRAFQTPSPTKASP